MIGSTTTPSVGPANSTLAIGMPATSDFCEPQNTVATSSACSKPQARAPARATIRPTASSTPTITTNRIEPRSVIASSDLFRPAQGPIHGRSRCPAANGSSNCANTCHMFETSTLPPRTCDMKPKSSGVNTMPIRLDAVAAQTAPATLPRATEVSAIDDCTVDGSAHRNSTPSTTVRSSARGISAVSAVPTTGNSAKVVATIAACSFQFVMPAKTASRDSRAPCRKNSDAMAITPRMWKISALVPWQGNTVATVTVATSAMTNTSGRSRRMLAGSMGSLFGSRRSVAEIEAGTHLRTYVAEAVAHLGHGVVGGVQDQGLGERGSASAVNAVRAAAEEQGLGERR